MEGLIIGNPPGRPPCAGGEAREDRLATGLTKGCKTSRWVSGIADRDLPGQARRRWSDEVKRRLMAETLVPGATVHAVAQRHRVNTSQLFPWRKRFRAELSLPAIEPAGPQDRRLPLELAPVPGASEIAGAPLTGTDSVTSGGLVEIDLPQGGRVRISGSVEPAVVTAALRALVRR